ncbi:nicotinate-nucleotide--dimethylbenzimidazole phosphoribosyltransferase [Pedobacter sp. MR2016-24]|uniref:nicotinate-nucleotide--dimethylbenzimidazole phosphoribosyltransferase n=1 Tax=Pedobacter sp. MR2016-24 TaxID=2994466 RepID=UPI0022451430|nr:nicotinate-nucleotide--dimethylbenzimidazole phosphoribosyltransferase [Pedobacter sp. MR2016-24]MCX2485599.1 nicotinate-nucleotide--dimethylbenzimidazole phosphoribosyltransferase [Pedobacter sp. MR2016-24]
MIDKELKYKIDHKTKPLGALGILEDLALRIGMVLGTTSPELHLPHLIVFAADHGIALEGVSAYPQEVTRQMVLNFLAGGAAINVFCRQHDIALLIVDAGVNFDFEEGLKLIDSKIGMGTDSFLNGPAMSPEQAELCLKYGSDMVNKVADEGCNVIGFGEMGIGNTSSAAVLMSVLCDLPLVDCIGRGTGLNDEQLKEKQRVLEAALNHYSGNYDVLDLMAHFGGFEILQIAGAMLTAAQRGMIVMVDGFIASVAYLCAFKINPGVKNNAVFTHQSDEKGHSSLLAHLSATPLLHLGLRLGEGTGCALAYPLLQSAVAFLKEMASFESAAVSQKS